MIDFWRKAATHTLGNSVVLHLMYLPSPGVRDAQIVDFAAADELCGQVISHLAREVVSKRRLTSLRASMVSEMGVFSST